MTEQTTPSPQPEKKRRWVAPTVVGAVALLVGVGIGSSGSDTTASSTPPTPAASPKVVTKTKTVTKVPASCIVALDQAEKIGPIASDFAHVVQSYLPLIQEAYKDGTYGQGVDHILSTMKANNAKVDKLTARAGAVVPRFNTADAQCRVAASK